MKKRLVIFSVLVLLNLYGCAMNHDEETMNSWLGVDRNQLIATWGPPDRVMTDGRGGEIFVYTRSAYLSYYQITAIRHAMFWINQYGIIYNWALKGDVR